jgi:protein ImuB
LALPQLPLQLAQRRLDPALAQALALAVVEGPVQRARVVHCNDQARGHGVRPGMPLAAAQALVRELIAVERDPAREHSALQELACWAYQFSPGIVACDDRRGSGLLLETGASERLFGGRRRLHERITRELRQLGYHAVGASAATPGAARMLSAARAAGLVTPPARGHGAADADDPAQLGRAIGALPLDLLGWEEPVTARLQALGLATVGAVLALPRDAFARRFGVARLADLDRVLGRVADPQPPFLPPERFTARIELPADTENVTLLQQPLQRLLLLLEGFLRGQNAGATALLLTALHSPRRAQSPEPTRLPLALAAPERDPLRLLQLYTERLARIRLPAPAVLLELQLERSAPYLPVSGSFLPPSPQDAPDADILRLAELLHARLGSDGVFQLQALGDHRPEFAYRVTPLSPDPPRTPAPQPAPAQRPLLILPEPRALAQPCADQPLPSYRGPLALLAGPERIESGWWDLGQPRRATVHRDYYVARNPQGQTLWVYRELAAPHRWFLHGYFA